MKLNLGAGGNPLYGFINMDIKSGDEYVKQGFNYIGNWKFQDGFTFEDNSIDAITISHAIYWLKEKEYISFLKECYRVLKPKGILRIVEENNDVSEEMKKQYEIPYKPNVNSKTGVRMLTKYFQKAGFKVYQLDSETTFYKDKSLLQNWHLWKAPALLFMEAIKAIGLWLTQSEVLILEGVFVHV